MQTTTLHVTGMTCQHCVAAVTKSLKSVAGVQSADVNLEQASATVTGSAPTQALVEAVVRAGYTATTEA
ncbi:MAG: CopZ family metallochaperone [Thiomonas sp.]|uniref:Copper-exporting ATPase n=1 Tax=mine drainage metagenome TaxID=410659 RepID=E6PTA3_9ZZZZ|nr:heavy-metal-associated domain-containing protein [Thiomonas sp. X19]SCC95111.1 Heavy metal transport/detoxification protein [Thiomonas sp. X19]